MMDGSVIVQDADASDWWKLTPDNTGSYVNGTWTQIASLPSGYGPLYCASAVLPDGRVFIMGGEYNLSGTASWTNLGAIYNPVTNVWTSQSAPTGWTQMGDTASCLLPNGKLLLADPLNTNVALFDPTTNSWVQTGGTGKLDRNDEEGLTLLPDGTLLTVNALQAPAAQRFIPSTFNWISAGSTPQSLEDPSSQELGPMVLRFDGTVWATGATGHSAKYTPPGNNTGTGSWAAGPDFPIVGGKQLDIADGPACLLPNGNVLVGASPGVFNAPTTFYEYDGTNLNPVPATPNSSGNPSYVGSMLMLPSGQVLYTDFSSDIEIYTPSGGPQSSWRPTITSVSSGVVPGGTYSITGTQFNGLSQTSAYGDDEQNATNYPIVRITNNSSGHVFYCRTIDPSTMAVATGSTPVSATFTVPVGTELGASTIQVVANGIASTGTSIIVGLTPSITSLSPASVTAPGAAFTLTINGSNFQTGAVASWTLGSVTTNLTTSITSSSVLTASVPASLVATAKTATVKVTNLGNIVSAGKAFTVNNPAPVMGSISPNVCLAHAGAFTLTVNGSGFISGATVKWKSGSTTTSLATTYVSAAKLTAVVPSSLLTTAGTAQVTVVTAAPGGGTSAVANFTVSGLAITSLSPNQVPLNNPAFTLTVNGAAFVFGSIVDWNGVALTTAFVSASQLSAQIPASDLTANAAANITVVNPGGPTSAPAIFIVGHYVPTITSISPSMTYRGTPSVGVTVNGTRFLPNAVVYCDSTPLTTTYYSPLKVVGQVPGSFMSTIGNHTITVVNPGTGGGTSNGVILQVVKSYQP